MRSSNRPTCQDVAAVAEGGLRLAELIAALSLASDLAIGEPMEHALRRCLLAVNLAGALGLPDDERRTVYDLALLRSVGCTGGTHEIAERFGDEQYLAPRYAVTDFGRPVEAVGFVVRHVGAGESLPRRAGKVADGLIAAKKPWERLLVAHCEVAQGIAGRMGLGPELMRALDHVFERWDGRGIPGRVEGEAIVRPARVVSLAQDMEVFHRLGGVESALAIARKRSGTAYDPTIVAQFCRAAAGLLSVLDAESIWDEALAVEPGPRRWLAPDQIDQAVKAIAGFVDLKSPYTIGHSTGVAELAAAAALACGLPTSDVVTVRRAGFLHDLGRAAISTTIWEKKGRLTLGDWERIRLHPYFTERLLARPRALARLGALGALHHERLDGSGYHRGASAPQLSILARLIAAADVYHAMTEARPHRPPHHPDAAAATLRGEVRAGRLDGDAVNAVLAAAGHRAPRTRREWPAGLSDREIDVLRLLAHGLPSRRIGERLSISEKTVGHHIAHIYDKLDVSSRAAATFFAMQHDLLAE